MNIFCVEKSTFYTEEYDLSDVVIVYDSFEKAAAHIKREYNVTINEVGDFEQITDDDELGEIHIGIVLRHVY